MAPQARDQSRPQFLRSPRCSDGVACAVGSIASLLLLAARGVAVDATPAALYGATDTMVLVDFNGSALPLDGDGDAYPNQYAPAGTATAQLDATQAIAGASVRFDVTAGAFYAQFNPYNYAANPSFPAGPRAFAHDYCAHPASWHFNTYNRLTFWIQRPASATPLNLGGDFYDFQVGTYVKQILSPDTTSDEAGGGHYYHNVGIPNLGGGAWTQIVLNMHPDHQRSIPTDPGITAYPTAPSGMNGGTDPEGTYNYFDTMTRIYLSDAPTLDTYRVDELTFYREPFPENDAQVFSLTSTYVPASQRLLVTWKKDWAGTAAYDVRYAFSDIHVLGWANAQPAPGGTGIVPPNSPGGYNGMYYDTTALPLAGHAVVYLGIQPQGASLFSEIAVPLTSFATTGTGSASGTGSSGGGGGGSGGTPASDATGTGGGGSGCGLGGGAAALLGAALLRRRRGGPSIGPRSGHPRIR